MIPLSHPTLTRPGSLRQAAEMVGRSRTWMVANWRRLVHHGRIKFVPPAGPRSKTVIDLADLDSHVRRCVKTCQPLLPLEKRHAN